MKYFVLSRLTCIRCPAIKWWPALAISQRRGIWKVTGWTLTVLAVHMNRGLSWRVIAESGYSLCMRVTPFNNRGPKLADIGTHLTDTLLHFESWSWRHSIVSNEFSLRQIRVNLLFEGLNRNLIKINNCSCRRVCPPPSELESTLICNNSEFPYLRCGGFDRRNR